MSHQRQRRPTGRIRVCLLLFNILSSHVVGVHARCLEGHAYEDDHRPPQDLTSRQDFHEDSVLETGLTEQLSSEAYQSLRALGDGDFSWPCGSPSQQLPSEDWGIEGFFRGRFDLMQFCWTVDATSAVHFSQFCQKSYLSCAQAFNRPCAVHCTMPLFVTRSNTWIVEFDSGDFIQFQVLGSKEQVPLPIHGWCRTAQEGERNTDPLTIDFHSLMQVGPPQDDMIASYIRSVSRNYVNTDLRVWFHAADALGQLQASSAVIRYHPAIPAGSQVRAVWAFLLGRRSCIVHPVKPPPFGLPDTIPQFIVTTVEGESFLASSTTGPIKCVGELLSFLLSLLSQGFGTFFSRLYGEISVSGTQTVAFALRLLKGVPPSSGIKPSPCMRGFTSVLLNLGHPPRQEVLLLTRLMRVSKVQGLPSLIDLMERLTVEEAAKGPS